MDRKTLRDIVVRALPFRQISGETEAVIARFVDALLPHLRAGITGAVEVPLSRFIESIHGHVEFLDHLAAEPERIPGLLQLLASGGMLANFLIQNPDLVFRSGKDAPADVSAAGLTSRLVSEVTDASSPEEIETGLDRIRLFVRGETVRIGLEDLAGRLDLAETFRRLTATAEAAVVAALRLAASSIRKAHGVPGDDAEIVPIGMGKLGGNELTYQSDLDLIFIYTAEGRSDGPRPLENHQYFVRLVQRFIAYLTTVTRAGFAYRIDMRLRPSGRAGALVAPLEALRGYYRDRALLWEHQALLKARLIGPNGPRRAEIKELIETEAYPARLPSDYRAQIHHLRMRKENELSHETPRRWNLKLGRGGILDVEAVIQMHQLAHGRSHRALRTTNTLEALEALSRTGHLEKKESKALRAGYLFLRALESRLRLALDRPVEHLDLDRADLDALAGQMKPPLPGGDALADTLRKHRERLREIYLDHFA